MLANRPIVGAKIVIVESLSGNTNAKHVQVIEMGCNGTKSSTHSVENNHVSQFLKDLTNISQIIHV